MASKFGYVITNTINKVIIYIIITPARCMYVASVNTLLQFGVSYLALKQTIRAIQPQEFSFLTKILQKSIINKFKTCVMDGSFFIPSMNSNQYCTIVWGALGV